MEQNAKNVAADPVVDTTGLEFAAEWWEGVGEAVQLWRYDAERRQTLRTSAFAAAGFAGPVVRWLTSDQSDRPDGNGPVRVSPSDVATIREMTATWRRLDNRYGGGQAREAAVSFLHHQVTPWVREGRYDQPTGSALLSATAELTAATGWMTYDCGLHGLAQRYFIQALRLARAGADTALGAEILAAMSHQAVYLGHGAEGVDLAGAARRVAIKAGVPALIAEAQVMAAHAHASLGAERACTTALTAAEATLSRADRASDPQWIGYFDQAYLAAKTGHCFAALGRGAHAEPHAQRSLDMNGAYVRGKVRRPARPTCQPGPDRPPCGETPADRTWAAVPPGLREYKIIQQPDSTEAGAHHLPPNPGQFIFLPGALI